MGEKVCAGFKKARLGYAGWFSLKIYRVLNTASVLATIRQAKETYSERRLVVGLAVAARMA